MARWNAGTVFYDKLNIEEGENLIYRITKQRAPQKRDTRLVNMITDEEGNVLIRQDKIKQRWKGYFETLLSVENEREALNNQPPVEAQTKLLDIKEVESAIRKMKCGKAPACSEISTYFFKSLDDLCSEMVCSLLEEIFVAEKIPSDWKKSEIVPICQRKGNLLHCNNYRGIKLMEHLLKVLERVLDQ